jgi:hypothetical protein
VDHAYKNPSESQPLTTASPGPLPETAQVQQPTDANLSPPVPRVQDPGGFSDDPAVLSQRHTDGNADICRTIIYGSALIQRINEGLTAVGDYTPTHKIASIVSREPPPYLLPWGSPTECRVVGKNQFGATLTYRVILKDRPVTQILAQ